MTRQLEINQPFDLKLSLRMGQAFRWCSLGNPWFSGVLGENLIHIGQPDGVDGAVFYRIGGPNGERRATSNDDEMLLRYFREDDNVAAIYYDISNRDERIKKLVRQYRGMRVLRQEPWECLVSYICSKSNKIPNIKQCVSEIVTLSRQTVSLGDDEQRTFPTPERILEAGLEGLIELEFAGRFSRDFPSAIRAAAQRVCNGELDMDALKQQPYPNVLYALMQGRPYGRKTANGIGLKIASCVALMSLDNLEAFPVDTHIETAVADYYPSAPKTPQAIVTWAQNYFGQCAGYAGQFMFCDREQGEHNAAYSTPSRQIEDTSSQSQAVPTQSVSRHLNRNYPCPKCGCEIGRVCRFPSGYRYEKGHSERGPR